ncbi:MAG: Bax inhibitor-1/YccA family protein [Clostridia bacterium]|nr:Bax inhibitor-1/YccA family protein [Clostridia bacterium]
MTFNGNPSLRRVIRNSQNGTYATEDGNVVSMKAMAWKSIALCAVTIVFAVLTAVLLFHLIETANVEALATLLIILACSALPLIIISLVIMFVPKTAGVLGFVYCMLEGAVMGVMSALIDLFFPGIALMAFLGTCIVFVISWVVFRLLGQKLSSNFVKFVLVSFISLVLLEGIGYLLSLFVPVFALVMGNIWVQLAISAVFILWAAFMIMVDLNNMHLLVDSGADKKYEWYAAFSLVTTLMWLYLEILELLMKLAVLASSRKN